MHADRISDPTVSVVVVNYKVPELLRQALRSIREAELYERTEVIVVDNASEDGSAQLVQSEFPEVRWVGLKSNIGFGKACNVGAQDARGTYLLFLNPDTVIQQNTLSACVDFMGSRPDIGAVGPKILNPDGTLQRSCRRSFPTPLVSFYHFSGLGRLFPQSRRFGGYNLTYLDPDESSQVDAVSGSCMFIRRSLFSRIGGFDERFFMYGEDLDLCRQVREHGYKVWYYPATQIVHFKGKSSLKRVVRTRAAFYEAMVLFSRKYRHTHEAFLPPWLVYVGIAILAVFSIGTNIFRTLTACVVDLVVINVVLAAGISARFAMVGKGIPYCSGALWLMTGMHGLLSLSFLVSFWYRGVYAKARYSARNAFVSGLLASVVFMATVYFVRSMAFSRIAFAFSSLAITVLLVGWRELLPRMIGGVRKLIFTTGQVVIVGDGPAAKRLIDNVESDGTARIVGIVWPSQNDMPGEFQGYPVLGSLENMLGILERDKIDILLIATSYPWYSHVIEIIASSRIRNLAVRWVPHDLLDKDTGFLPKVIPLQDFTV